MSSVPIHRLKHFAAIVESSEDAIIGKDIAGIITAWNKGAERLYGYFASEVIGRPISLLMPPEFSNDFPVIMQKIRRGERVAHYETLRKKKDGELVVVSLSVSPIRDQSGKIVGASAIARDISKGNFAEHALSEISHALEERTMLLQSREELLQVFVKRVPAAVAMLDRDMRYLQVSDRWCADFSLDGSSLLGRSHYEIFPDIPDRWKEIHRRGLAGETVCAEEDCWEREGGTTWLHWEIRPWQSLKGSPGGIIIFAEDITKRKQAEEALSDLSRRLLLAQEHERARIGRELHDDINQRLAMLAIELKQLQDYPAELGSRLQELQKQTTEISDDVEALAHELHSSKLEYLGAVAGIRSCCKEFGERQNMDIEFKSDVASVLPLEVGVCFFRVLQEALHNAVKYSGTKRVEVQLEEHANEVHLVVRDSGRGFDIEAARQTGGLGLTSMQERVRLVGGAISIQSKPMDGTTIHVRVPLELKHEAQRVDGGIRVKSKVV
jgi:PAS domain S-box-containing protein